MRFARLGVALRFAVGARLAVGSTPERREVLRRTVLVDGVHAHRGRGVAAAGHRAGAQPKLEDEPSPLDDEEVEPDDDVADRPPVVWFGSSPHATHATGAMSALAALST